MEKISFDISKLELSELIKVYDDINAFIAVLNSKIIEEQEETNE